MFINPKRLKIVGTILAKNEEDIIAANIEHHLCHGITHFIITDNNSSDQTRAIAARYPEVVEIIDELGTDHNQSLWVSRMARLACKLHPDWIVHLDADEFWCGLTNLAKINATYVASDRCYLHPPSTDSFSMANMRYYLDFDQFTSLPGETKVAHRPDPDIIITHGNHGYENRSNVLFSKETWRHHFPVRSSEQFIRKAVLGHRSLIQRDAICQRWKLWHDLHLKGQLVNLYHKICQNWESFKIQPNKKDFLELIEVWATQEVRQLFMDQDKLPLIGQWPKLN